MPTASQTALGDGAAEPGCRTRPAHAGLGFRVRDFLIRNPRRAGQSVAYGSGIVHERGRTGAGRASSYSRLAASCADGEGDPRRRLASTIAGFTARPTSRRPPLPHPIARCLGPRRPPPPPAQPSYVIFLTSTRRRGDASLGGELGERDAASAGLHTRAVVRRSSAAPRLAAARVFRTRRSVLRGEVRGVAVGHCGRVNLSPDAARDGGVSACRTSSVGECLTPAEIFASTVFEPVHRWAPVSTTRRPPGAPHFVVLTVPSPRSRLRRRCPEAAARPLGPRVLRWLLVASRG